MQNESIYRINMYKYTNPELTQIAILCHKQQINFFYLVNSDFYYQNNNYTLKTKQ